MEKMLNEDHECYLWLEAAISEGWKLDYGLECGCRCGACYSYRLTTEKYDEVNKCWVDLKFEGATLTDTIKEAAKEERFPWLKFEWKYL